MLINKEDITKLARPISGNIAYERVTGYIGEAEISIIKPAIGDALYMSLLECVAATPSDAQKLILDGGKYEVDGKAKMLCGLRVAIAYYAYAKVLKNNSVNVTSASVVSKLGEHSTAVDYKQIMLIYDDAVAYGDRCMTEVLLLLNDKKEDYPLFEAGAKTPEQRSMKVTIAAIGN